MAEAVQDIVGLTKACTCEGATASGPRVVIQESVQEDGDVVVSAGMARMACDECDTPWEPADA